MWGVVASIDGFDDEVCSLMEEDGYDPADFTFHDAILEDEIEALDKVMDENEVNFICAGEIVRYAINNPADAFPTIYFIVNI
jgi:hypothetical protein